mmetsp:Transcript_17847/g.26355  ORF Transcript_17847/g.26355 Transcript_17847/m.26355 type:complete len:155 (-) Transcript_17847:177-641(-)
MFVSIDANIINKWIDSKKKLFSCLGTSIDGYVQSKAGNLYRTDNFDYNAARFENLLCVMIGCQQMMFLKCCGLRYCCVHLHCWIVFFLVLLGLIFTMNSNSYAAVLVGAALLLGSVFSFTCMMHYFITGTFLKQPNYCGMKMLPESDSLEESLV